jgi:hypothetical protein
LPVCGDLTIAGVVGGGCLVEDKNNMCAFRCD